MTDEIKPDFGQSGDIDSHGQAQARGWNDDHRAEVFLLIDDLGVRPLIHNMIHYAYENGYEHPSDGISFPIRWWAQLNFQSFRMKHPIGVMHDMLYREGPRCPFVVMATQKGEIKLSPSTAVTDYWNDTAIRQWDDNRFGEGLWDCENWVRAYSWEWGLRLFGYTAYSGYRAMESRNDWSHICNPAILRPPAVVPEAVIEKAI